MDCNWTKPVEWCQMTCDRLNIREVSSVYDFSLVSAVTGSRDCEIFKPLNFLQLINLSNCVKLNRLIECTTFVNLQISKKHILAYQVEGLVIYRAMMHLRSVTYSLQIVALQATMTDF